MATKLLVHEAGSSHSQFYTDDFQRGLARWNHDRLAPGFPDEDWHSVHSRDSRMLRLEGDFLDELRLEVVQEAARAPTDPGGFIDWFEGLKESGPGQGDPLFPWLATHASIDEMRWF
ncbi:MAG: iron-containing redox enzyme family protein, partial [Allosphingosinicella sp.]